MSFAGNGRGVYRILSGKGAYAVCVDTTNKSDSQWLYRENGTYKYINRHWRSFKTITKIAGLFYPNDPNTYYQSTWVMPVTQSEYTQLSETCAEYGANYTPQPYSKHGWYLFAVVDDAKARTYKDVTLQNLKKGWVTPFWWNGSSWVKSLPNYVTSFEPESALIEH